MDNALVFGPAAAGPGSCGLARRRLQKDARRRRPIAPPGWQHEKGIVCASIPTGVRITDAAWMG